MRGFTSRDVSMVGSGGAHVVIPDHGVPENLGGAHAEDGVTVVMETGCGVGSSVSMATCATLLPRGTWIHAIRVRAPISMVGV